MTYWHEPKKHSGGWIFPPRRGRRVAAIFRGEDARVAMYARNGRYFPASTPSVSSELEWEWGITWVQDEEGRAMRTLSDDLSSAEEIAGRELAELVARDPEIRLRETMP